MIFFLIRRFSKNSHCIFYFGIHRELAKKVGVNLCTLAEVTDYDKEAEVKFESILSNYILMDFFRQV